MTNEAGTLIGDVVRSRGAIDRSQLHARLSDVLDAVNRTLSPLTPLRVTVGDEYQGAFATLADAVRASLQIRLALLPAHDVRQGLGWGEVTVLQEEPRVEDGPGWWAARDAVHAVEEAEGRSATRHRRTAYRLPEDGTGPEVAWVEGMLVLRDELVGDLSERSLSVLRDLLGGRTQRDIAESLGVSPSAVSQRVRADGLNAIVSADELLREVR